MNTFVIVYGEQDEWHRWLKANPDLAPLVTGIPVSRASSRLDGIRVMDWTVLVGARQERFREALALVESRLDRAKRVASPENRLRHFVLTVARSL